MIGQLRSSLVNTSQKSEDQRVQDSACGKFSYSKLQEVIEENHPRQINLETNARELYPVCKSHTGRISLYGDRKKSDFEWYGIGLTMFFKFLKFIIFTFSIVCVLALPNFIILLSSNKIENEFYGFSQMTLGALGESQDISSVTQYQE